MTAFDDYLRKELLREALIALEPFERRCRPWYVPPMKHRIAALVADKIRKALAEEDHP